MEQTLYLIYAIFMFIVGTLFGSFFTLAIYRIPRKQDITHTRSYCPTCKHKLGFFDCFPILSYVSTFGRCKYCKEKISIRYLLIELLSGFTFLFIYMFFGFSIETLILIACYVYLFLVIGTDIMKEKMTEEEKKQVKDIVEKKKLKKAGSINIEILIAVIIFIFFFITAVYTKTNYTNSLAMYKRKIDATNVCLNVMNEERAKDFYSVQNRVGEETIDGIKYAYTVTITDKLKDTDEQYDNIRNVNVVVEYYVKGDMYTVSLDALKVVPLYEV